MATFKPQLFAQFIYDTLSSNSDITSQVTGIYTFALQDTQPPYLVIHIDAASPFNASNLTALSFDFTIYCYSSEAGYSEVFAICEAVYAALQTASQTLAAHQIIHSRLVDSRFKRLADGSGVEAALEFRSVMQDI